MTQIASLINGIVTNFHPTRISSGSNNAGDIVTLDESGLINPTMIPGTNIDGGNSTPLVAPELPTLNGGMS